MRRVLIYSALLIMGMALSQLPAIGAHHDLSRLHHDSSRHGIRNRQK
jgi:hypothetical protein